MKGGYKNTEEQISRQNVINFNANEFSCVVRVRRGSMFHCMVIVAAASLRHRTITFTEIVKKAYKLSSSLSRNKTVISSYSEIDNGLSIFNTLSCIIKSVKNKPKF